MKHYKPGERFNKFQEKKKKYQAKHKTYSEADMGSMKGYDPNLGLGKAGMRRLSAPKMSAPKMPAKPVMFGGKALSGQNANSTRMMMKRKHSKHKKEHSTAAIKGIKKFVEEEAKEKKHKKMHCKVCGGAHMKHMKSRAPKGAHGRAAVHALGRTRTTGNFAKIEAKSGKGAAIAAYQNALRAHKAGK